MRMLYFAAFGLSLALGVSVLVQGKPPDATQDETKPELRGVKGTVRSDNAKITFVADEGGKSWDAINPETLKDHVGHHVQLSAPVYTEKGQIHVITVTML